MEEKEEVKSDVFLSGTGGFVFPSPRDLVLGRDETPADTGNSGKEGKGEVWGVERAPGLAVRGEEGVRGEDTGVPGVGVLDWLE